MVHVNPCLSIGSTCSGGQDQLQLRPSNSQSTLHFGRLRGCAGVHRRDPRIPRSRGDPVSAAIHGTQSKRLGAVAEPTCSLALVAVDARRGDMGVCIKGAWAGDSVHSIGHGEVA